MKISIHIEDATPAVLKALVGMNENVNTITIPRLLPAPNGLKKDGTPAKKRGRPVGSTKKAKV